MASFAPLQFLNEAIGPFDGRFREAWTSVRHRRIIVSNSRHRWRMDHRDRSGGSTMLSVTGRCRARLDDNLYVIPYVGLPTLLFSRDGGALVMSPPIPVRPGDRLLSGHLLSDPVFPGGLSREGYQPVHAGYPDFVRHQITYLRDAGKVGCSRRLLFSGTLVRRRSAVILIGPGNERLRRRGAFPRRSTAPTTSSMLAPTLPSSRRRRTSKS